MRHAVYLSSCLNRGKRKCKLRWDFFFFCMLWSVGCNNWFYSLYTGLSILSQTLILLWLPLSWLFYEYISRTKNFIVSFILSAMKLAHNLKSCRYLAFQIRLQRSKAERARGKNTDFTCNYSLNARHSLHWLYKMRLKLYDFQF